MQSSHASTVDDHVADGPWRFDEAVTDRFDDMLARSIPQYDVMRDTVARLAARYWQPGGAVVDLGCSRGEALATVRDRIHELDNGDTARFYGVEVSEPMAEAATERFRDAGDVTVWRQDLRRWYPSRLAGGRQASVTLAVLTLMFVPIEHRQRVVRDAYRATAPGGALIVVEKVLGDTADLDAAMVDAYLALKARHGYSQEQIDRKRLALEGVLVPVTAAWNEAMLRRAGFEQVDCFWRWMTFAGWVAVKGERDDG